MAPRAAEPGVNGKHTTRRSDRFLDGLKDVSSVTFVSHVHPDPDSLGSMMGLAHLVETVSGQTHPPDPRRPYQPGREPGDGRSARPRSGSHRKGGRWPKAKPSSWWTASQTPAGTTSTLRSPLRRHRPPRHARRSRRRSLRRRSPHLGATCSLVTSYLMEQNIEVPPRPRHRPSLWHRDGTERLSA